MIITPQCSPLEDHDINARYIFACVFMPGGQLVLACGTYGLKVLDKNFRNQKDYVGIIARNVCVVNETNILVTNGNGKQLQYVQVIPKIIPGTIMQMNRNCYGVDVHNDAIYVTCHDAPGNGEIQVLNGNGRFVRTIVPFDWLSTLKQPEYVKVNRSGDKLFVSDSVTNTIICLNQQGRVLYQYSEERELKCPKGMLVDAQDNVCICGHKSDTVLVISAQGRLIKVLLKSRDGLKYPLCLALRSTDSCMAIGTLGSDKALLKYQCRPLFV